MHRLLAFLRISLTALLAVVCIFGDWLVGLNSNSSIAKAIFDNVTHACVGLLTASLLFIQLDRRISSAERNAAIIVCCLVSSLIDVDHFIAARSWKLTVRIEIDIEINLFGEIVDHFRYALSFPLECHEFATTTFSPLYHDSAADSDRWFIHPKISL